MDADLQRLDPSYTKGHGGDQWGELFATVNLMTARIRAEDGSVEIVSRGFRRSPPSSVPSVMDAPSFHCSISPEDSLAATFGFEPTTYSLPEQPLFRFGRSSTETKQ